MTHGPVLLGERDGMLTVPECHYQRDSFSGITSNKGAGTGMRPSQNGVALSAKVKREKQGERARKLTSRRSETNVALWSLISPLFILHLS